LGREVNNKWFLFPLTNDLKQAKWTLHIFWFACVCLNINLQGSNNLVYYCFLTSCILKHKQYRRGGSISLSVSFMVLWYLFINTLIANLMERENKYMIVFVFHNLNVWGWAIRDAWQIAFEFQRMFIQVMCFFRSSLHSIYEFLFSISTRNYLIIISRIIAFKKL